jgi:RHS repeat-associated protein
MITDDYNVSSPILEAYSYYPFGLQQKGIGLTAASPLHNYKNTFQQQELNENLGIGLYEFKYRMDDPQIGRFWQIDPLADKYVYNSTYAFSENKVINGVELEGLELAPSPYNPLDVAKSVGRIKFTEASQKGGRKIVNHFGLLIIGFVTDNPEFVEPIVADVVGGFVVLAGASSEISATTSLDATNISKGEAPSRSKLLRAGRTGSYTTTHKSGKRYHGKGPFKRAKQSAKRVERVYDDPVVSVEWTPAKNDKEAFKAENERLENDGGKNNPDNYNKRDSPGKKYKKEDRE